MKVFATNFLETPVVQTAVNDDQWNWSPNDPQIKKNYATGTAATRVSTLPTDRDHQTDESFWESEGN
ncbi:MAG: hypothetical protein JWQ79_3181 [Mucilaginibacter sp.]|nr:hypothetical protein [Mucilaginibacter sp.]